MTLTDVVDAYLTRQRSLGMRFECAGRLLHRFSRVMGNPKIDEVTPEAVAEFLHGEGSLSATWLLRYRVLTGFIDSPSAADTSVLAIAEDFAEAAAATNSLCLFH